MDGNLQRRRISASSLSISIKAISRPHQRYEREVFFFVPIAARQNGWARQLASAAMVRCVTHNAPNRKGRNEKDE